MSSRDGLIAERKRTRKTHASPYARPQQKKSSGWSLTGIFGFLNPMRRGAREPEAKMSIDEEEEKQVPSKRENATTIAPVLPQIPIPEIRTPPQLTRASSFPAEEVVSNFLSERGHTLSENELKGLISLVKHTTVAEEENEDQPFRFTSTAPSTPARGNTPTFSAPKTSERRVLTKNPNGSIRWEGGGSAKQPRNRFKSPAFGPSRSMPEKLKLPAPVSSDNKRRRVSISAEPESSKTQQTPARSVSTRSAAPPPNNFPFPVSNANATRSSSRIPVLNANATHSSSRIKRTSVPPQKPSTPAHPSPLRQTWSQVREDTSPSSSTRSSAAATYMASLIKDANVTVVPKPDVSNPYQISSPVVVPVKKRTRAVGRATPPVKENLAEKEPGKEALVEDVSPQSIIEATMPKGSKRSRPPANFTQNKSESAFLSVPAAQPTRRSPRLDTNAASINAQEDEDDMVIEQEQPSKKQKKATVNGYGPAPSRNSFKATVESIDDEEDEPPKPNKKPEEKVQEKVQEKKKESNTHIPPIASSSSRSAFVSAPKEPSKLRYSYQPQTSVEGLPSKSSSSTFTAFSNGLPTPGISSTNATNGFFASTSTTTTPEQLPSKSFSFSSALSSTPRDAKAIALSRTTVSLPSFAFDLSPSKSEMTLSTNDKAKEKAKLVPESSLPSFDFSKPGNAAASSSASSSSSAVKAFDWSAAGMAKPPAPASSTWQCGVCMLSNPASAVEKCTVCEAPKPAAAAKKSSGTNAGAEWVCGTCMLKNPASATEKCQICEAPK